MACGAVFKIRNSQSSAQVSPGADKPTCGMKVAAQAGTKPKRASDERKGPGSFLGDDEVKVESTSEASDK